ncbi:glycosyltransferase family 4 protein [Roseobacter sinensis]|uniref:Glycosyltransferase family 4 protein n=1 Tax=Roseobacter sinensis TaxID=2931391 RepID=A0ABT3BL20_9RHOB|nr:glycosyltransferase family 4 protein [Roseobacter sp. WL0113]
MTGSAAGHIGPLHQAHARRQQGQKLLRAAGWKALHPRRRSVLYGPAIFDNPYQTLLYSAFASRVSAAAPARLKLYQTLGLAQVYHLHWDEFHLTPGPGGQAPSYCARLEAFQARGGTLVWTVHNADAHTEMAPQTQALFDAGRAFLCARADVIHVHSQQAQDLIQTRYGADPARIVVIPHPSYLGWYAPPADPAQLAATGRFLAFGFFRENKGLDLILEGLRRAAETATLEGVHIAGRGAERVQDAVLPGVPMQVSSGFIPDARVAEIFGEADFCIFGFSSILTSGSVMLALTFGTVPILPDLPALRDVLPASLRRFCYRAGDAEDLARTIAEAAQMPAEAVREMRQAALDAARRHDPETISARLERAIEAVF